MFKKIPGNNLYRINLDKEFIDFYGNRVELKSIVEDFVEIELFGKMRVVRKRLLALIAWYEIDIQSIVANQIDDQELTLNNVFDRILFCKNLNNVLKIRCKYTMVFTKPLVFIDGFRYIPSFPRYAIDINGVVIDTTNNSVINKVEIDSSGYPCHYIYNPDIGASRWTRTHRLMALAWLSNTNFAARPFVNHLNGNKKDFSLKNLEWCSHIENVKHANDTGLNSCGIKMKTRDKNTGIIEIYSSASEMCAKLGLTGVSASAWTFKMPGFLLRRRYEVKLAEDDSPWFYSDKSVEHSVAFYSIHVLDKETGEQKLYINVRALVRDFSLIRSKTNKIDDIVLSFKESYPNHEISYERNAAQGPYIVRNVSNGLVLEFTSMKKAAEHIGITRTEIQFDIARSRNFVYDNQWIVQHSKNKNLEIDDFIHKKKSVNKVECINVDSGEIQIAASIREASRLTDVQPNTIASAALTGKRVKRFIFRLLNQ